MRKRRHVIVARQMLAYEGIDSQGRTFVRLVMTGGTGRAVIDLTQDEARKFGVDLARLAKQVPLETMEVAGNA